MIQVSRPSIGDLEWMNVSEAVDNSEISFGDFIPQFEDAWASYNGYKYGVSCNSGTTAMYLALLALGIGEGDEVIVPEFTMIATAWAVTYTGATPVFVDCLDDLTIDPKLARKAITKKTRAIMPVPIYGRPVSREIYELANSHNLLIVEDMAEGHGIKPKGDIACFSFQGNKIITTGEGGMCLTNDKRIADEMRKLSSLYFDEKRTLIHQRIGHNFRMTNLQAAIGCAQIGRIGELLEKRQRVAFWYDKYLPKKYLMPKRDVVWMYDINCGDKQEEIKVGLYDLGVDSRYFFKPMSQQPMYLGEYEELEAYKWSRRGLYLPTHPDLSEENIKYIAKCLKSL